MNEPNKPAQDSFSTPSPSTSPEPEQANPEQSNPEQASEAPELSKGKKEELASVVWGEKNELEEDKPVTYDLVTSTFTITLERKGVISVNEEGTEDPPFMASVTPGKGYIRMGHIREELPMILRFPRPVLTLPDSTFECFSTYPTRPALYYEKEDGTTMKLLELPGISRKKSTYGSLTDAVVTYLHYGEHATHPDELPDNPLSGVVKLKLKNNSPDPQEVSIILLNPAQIDFYSKNERLCLGEVRLELFSEEQAEVHYKDRPSIEGATLVDRHSEQQTHARALDILRSVIGERDMSGGY